MSAPQATEPGISQDIFCQDCGYNLRGLTGERCPECGRSLAGLRSSVSKIPWVHRKEIGRFRAYWKTVWFVMFRQKEFCDEMARPVCFNDSQKFRWLTVAFAYLPLLIAAILDCIAHTKSPTANELFLAFWTNFFLGLTAHAGGLLFFAGATGIPSYFFESHYVDVPLRNRAIALSYYACGPLSLLVLPAIAAVLWLNIGLDHKAGMLAMLFTFILPIALFGIWWVDLDHLSARLMPERRQSTIMIALALPFLWLLLFALLVVVAPLIIFNVTIVIRSIV
jgi:MFS family permease